MLPMLTALGVSVVAFAATNIDDLFVLLAFFGDARFRTREVVAGQFLGIAALIAASFVLASLAIVISPSLVRYLGIIPILLGLKAVWDLYRGEEEAESAAPPKGNALRRTLTVAAVTLSNGADNIGVYVPIFSSYRTSEALLISAGFLLMTGLWCALAHYLVNHPAAKKPIETYGHLLFPVVLIGIGLKILLQL